MASLICKVLAIIQTVALFGLGAWISLIGGLKQMRTNSPSEGIMLIVIGAIILSLSGIMATIMSKLLSN